ncbi:MAG: hypothetical protein JSS91_13500 [Bacteroidetes bacterium]|nr:hypothetical protein [Bacteroidota bacterium]
MFQYHLSKEEERLFGKNFTFLIKLAAKKNAELTKYDIISTTPMEDSFFQHKGTDKRNMMIHFSDNPEFSKYIRLSYVGNYYFGFRISVMNFIKTFEAKDADKRSLTANKFLYCYMIKNYFRNPWYGTVNHTYIETRFKDHRKIHDEGILIDAKRRNLILKNLESFFKFSIYSEKEQYDLIKFFLKLKKGI